jgi:hypothetical protein
VSPEQIIILGERNLASREAIRFMIRLYYIKRGLLVYTITGILAALLLFTYLLTDSYNKNLKTLKDNLQRVIIKRGVIRRDLSVYRKNLNQLLVFSGGRKNPERAILERIDSLKRLYPELSIRPSGFVHKNGTTELEAEVTFNGKSYYEVIKLIGALSEESMPLYKFSSISISPSLLPGKAIVQCRITGRFLFAGKNED